VPEVALPETLSSSLELPELILYGFELGLEYRPQLRATWHWCLEVRYGAANDLQREPYGLAQAYEANFADRRLRIVAVTVGRAAG